MKGRSVVSYLPMTEGLTSSVTKSNRLRRRRLSCRLDGIKLSSWMKWMPWQKQHSRWDYIPAISVPISYRIMIWIIRWCSNGDGFGYSLDLTGATSFDGSPFWHDKICTRLQSINQDYWTDPESLCYYKIWEASGLSGENSFRIHELIDTRRNRWWRHYLHSSSSFQVVS